MNDAIYKAQHYEIEIIDMGEGGEGIGKIQDFTVFVPKVLLGDRVEVCLTKVKKNYGFGKMVKMITPSPYRTVEGCEKETACGGCQFQHLAYEKQLEFKASKVRGNLIRIGGFSAEEVDEKLHRIMIGIHDSSAAAAEEYGLGYNLVAGANIAGFKKVAEAMLAQGVF